MFSLLTQKGLIETSDAVTFNNILPQMGSYAGNLGLQVTILELHIKSLPSEPVFTPNVCDKDLIVCALNQES